MEEITRKEEQILLAVHSLKDNAYLISIREHIKKHTGKSYSVGTIYAPLSRMHLNGYLDSNLEKVAMSNKPVRYYKLTKKGYEALLQLKNRRMNYGVVLLIQFMKSKKRWSY